MRNKSKFEVGQAVATWIGGVATDVLIESKEEYSDNWHYTVRSADGQTHFLRESVLRKPLLRKANNHDLLALEARVSKLEATVASMNGIDQPTIERCSASIHCALDEIINALENTAAVTGTRGAMDRANAARLAKSRIREMEAVLAGVSHA